MLVKFSVIVGTILGGLASVAAQNGTTVMSPYVMIISLFTPEQDVWLAPYNLTNNNITVPGLSPKYPDVHCNTNATICQVTLDEGRPSLILRGKGMLM